jgi:glycosyltransferase involved in cell wall biosynthesis
MALALQRLKVPMVVLVHDADHHPGDGQPLQMRLQRALCRRAAAVGALSSHVGARLVAQGLAGVADRPLIQLRFPPLPIVLPAAMPDRKDGLHLLSFGRLLPYKGLDLLADALAQLGPQPGLFVRVVGAGPESAELERLRSMPNVTVENRWVPETELGTLLTSADALVLPYREASQSGVAALALAAGRRVVATRVGGLAEQLGSEPLATLCDPNAAALAKALADLIRTPIAADAPAATDARESWREVAAILLQQIADLPLS